MGMNLRKEGLSLPVLGAMSPRRVTASRTDIRRSTDRLDDEEQRATLLSPTTATGGFVGDGSGDTPVQLPLKPGVDYINPGEDEQCELYGYSLHVGKSIISGIFVVLSCGLLGLVFHWVPKLMLLATHRRCSLKEATKVMLVEHYNGKYKRFYVKNVKKVSAEQIRFESDYSTLRGGGVSLEPPTSFSSTERRSGINEEQLSPASEISPSEITLEVMEEGNVTGEEAHPAEMPFFLIPSSSEPSGFREVSSIRWFKCKKICYLWDNDQECFYRLNGLDQSTTTDFLHSMKGLSWMCQGTLRLVYGENAIQVPVSPWYKLVFFEALNPFYIFQVASVLLWYIDDYIYYATVIVITSVSSIVSEVYQMHRNQVSLSKTIHSSDVVEVIRDNGEVETIPSEHIVPGDILNIPPKGCIMQCDAVLLQGSAIVNESMLTGESVPVTKTHLVREVGIPFKEKEHSRHVLYCGTQIIQTRYYGNEKVVAVVLRTGFLTSKGSLVRSIMYPPPVDFKFLQDAYRFIMVLVGIASLGFVYTVATKVQRGESLGEIVVDSLDLITIVVPPALPMAMTVGVLYALNRLKHQNIFCISPKSINISGVIDCVCFDKTGTLTEDGLDMKGIVPVRIERGLTATDPYMDGMTASGAELPMDHLLYAMATCHSITLIDGERVGDPLDLIMFTSTDWELDEPGQDDTNRYDMIMPTVVHPKAPQSGDVPNTQLDLAMVAEGIHSIEVGILREFPFSSSLQRMSVITRILGESGFNIYCKGSPEMIASLSAPSSLPSNFHDVLLQYTLEGYRVIGFGYKPIQLSYVKSQSIRRDQVETDLIFLGLLVMENKLKGETKPVIEQFCQANIRTVMVTGDNMLTALSVARECLMVTSDVITVEARDSSEGRPPMVTFGSANGSRIVRPASSNIEEESICIEDPMYCFAVEGSSWAIIQKHFPKLVPKLVVRGTVFARMSPDQKQQLVMALQSVGYCVGMCGDGANDCGALKSAHAGISLSDTEASVASPFTSRESNISCVPKLIREGRAALVTSFGVFKYMATYSLTQFVSVMILYSIDSNLSDFQFLYIDLFLITVFALFFGRTLSYKGNLADKPPPSSLISVAPIASMLIHIAVIITFQTFGFFYVQQQDWFIPYNSTQEESGNHENYVVFTLSQFQYIILAVVFSKGLPYRQRLYTNYLLMGSIMFMTVFSIYLTIAPAQFFVDLFEFALPPDTPQGNFFHWQIIMFAALNCVIAGFIEYFVIDYVEIIGRNLNSISRKSETKKKYLSIEKVMSQTSKWSRLVKVSADDYTVEIGNNSKVCFNGTAVNELSLNPKKLVKKDGKTEFGNGQSSF